MSAQGVVMVVLGAVLCFMGYSMFKTMLPLWGFIIFGWLFMSYAPLLFKPGAGQELIWQVGAFFVGGIIGALIATPLYYVIIFVSGALMGAIAGVLLGIFMEMGGLTSFGQLDRLTAVSFPPQASSALQFILMVILGIIMGVLALNFQSFMITASSAFVGAGGLVSGLSGAILNAVNTQGSGVILLFVWVLIGLAGMFVQFRILGDEV